LCNIVSFLIFTAVAITFGIRGLFGETYFLQPKVKTASRARAQEAIDPENRGNMFHRNLSEIKSSD
jgi:hypothetical protein